MRDGHEPLLHTRTRKIILPTKDPRFMATPKARGGSEFFEESPIRRGTHRRVRWQASYQMQKGEVIPVNLFSILFTT